MKCWTGGCKDTTHAHSVLYCLVHDPRPNVQRARRREVVARTKKERVARYALRSPGADRSVVLAAVRASAEVYEIEEVGLLSGRRQPDTIAARRAAVLAIRDATTLSLEKIGVQFSIDHASISVDITKGRALERIDTTFRDATRAATAAIRRERATA